MFIRKIEKNVINLKLKKRKSKKFVHRSLSGQQKNQKLNQVKKGLFDDWL